MFGRPDSISRITTWWLRHGLKGATILRLIGRMESLRLKYELRLQITFDRHLSCFNAFSVLLSIHNMRHFYENNYTCIFIHPTNEPANYCGCATWCGNRIELMPDSKLIPYPLQNIQHRRGLGFCLSSPRKPIYNVQNV